MSYKPKGLGHVNIYVRNAERSRAWYEDLLGLHTYDFTPGRAAFMSADREVSHEIALIEVGDAADGPRKGQVGLNHMAWYMHSLDDLKELYSASRREISPSRTSPTTVCPSASTSRTPTAMVSRCPMSCRAANGDGKRISSWAAVTPKRDAFPDRGTPKWRPRQLPDSSYARRCS